MLPEPNRKWPLVSYGGQRSYQCSRTQSSLSCCQSLPNDRSNITVCLCMDNTSAVARVSNKGATCSPQLVNLTLELCKWCFQKSILITDQYPPGNLNNAADRESREFYDSSEWEIDPQKIQPFLRRCSVDLFASCLTVLLPTYASWKPDPGATGSGAMTFDWSLLKGYAFHHLV